MRFISHSRRFMVQIFPSVKMVENGIEREISPQLVAKFKQGDLTSDELSFARSLWDRSANGRTLEMDQVTKTDLLGRLSVYDTDAPDVQQEFDEIDRALDGQPHAKLARDERWKPGDAERLTIERLMEAAARGNNGDFAAYTEAAVPPPWPKYDDFPGSAEDLLEVLVEQGHHLPQALAYERQNGKRRVVIEMLEEEIARQQPQGAEIIPA
jgi:hypothetical protein